MSAIRRIRTWLGQFVSHPAYLLEVFLGCGTLGMVIIDLINYGNPRVVPSTALLIDVLPELTWLTLIGLIAILQLVAVHVDDPEDLRHPFVQPTKWMRMAAAGALLIWYLILVAAVGITLGLSRFQAMYGMAAAMSLQIVAHVLFRKRR
jgi:hypothetical protein